MEQSCLEEELLERVEREAGGDSLKLEEKFSQADITCDDKVPTTPIGPDGGEIKLLTHL